jgi:carboxylesterase type B
MVFGESAGGGSVSCHLTNKKSWGLFSSAAIESGSLTSWLAQPMNVAEDKFAVLLKETGCGDVNCLLKKSTQEIAEASFKIPSVSTYCTYAPTADGVEMTTHPWISVSDGVIVDVPILHGTNMDEATLFATLPKGATLEQAERFWKRGEFYPDYAYTDADVTILEGLYLNQTYRNVPHVSQEFWAAAHSVGDAHFACGALYLSKTLAEMQASHLRSSNVFQYHFQHARANMRFVTHFSEVPYVFNWGYMGFRQHPDDQDMADVMTAFWGNFIIDSDPSSGSVEYTKQLPAWTPFTHTKEETVLLPSKDGISIANGIKASECDFIMPLMDQSFRKAFA